MPTHIADLHQMGDVSPCLTSSQMQSTSQSKIYIDTGLCDHEDQDTIHNLASESAQQKHGCNTISSSGPPSPYIDLYYGDQPIHLSLSTAAEHNLISASFARELGIEIFCLDSSCIPDLASSCSNVRGIIGCVFYRDRREYSFEALVVPDLHMNILGGLPFIDLHDIMIRPAKSHLVVGGWEVISYATTNALAAAKSASINQCFTTDAQKDGDDGIDKYVNGTVNEKIEYEMQCIMAIINDSPHLQNSGFSSLEVSDHTERINPINNVTVKPLCLESEESNIKLCQRYHMGEDNLPTDGGSIQSIDQQDCCDLIKVDESGYINHTGRYSQSDGHTPRVHSTETSHHNTSRSECNIETMTTNLEQQQCHTSKDNGSKSQHPRCLDNVKDILDMPLLCDHYQDYQYLASRPKDRKDGQMSEECMGETESDQTPMPNDIPHSSVLCTCANVSRSTIDIYAHTIDPQNIMVITSATACDSTSLDLWRISVARETSGWVNKTVQIPIRFLHNHSTRPP